ncbi:MULTISPECIES: polysaccharide deacetylase family protein [unclassified Janthinobacterium]|uniref:polysaccharide deacetylase family protein n=1 Tax=unclassified Janthinobacterium TaxID=2610881 RepID=UPI00069A0DE6|nr:MULTISPECIES: polysaccharide deacetylase family protein [unclassified Janthinobacterium]
MPTIPAGGTPQTITLPEGQVLNASGSPGAAAVIYRLDQVLDETNLPQSWLVGAGALASIGPYAGQERFVVTCMAGSVDVATSSASLNDAAVALDAFGRVIGVGAWGSATAIERRPEWKKDNFRRKRFAVIDDMSAAVSGAMRWTRFGGTAAISNSQEFVKDSLGCFSAMKISGLSSFERLQGPLQKPIVPSAGTVTVHLYITEMPTDYSNTPPTPPTYRGCGVQVVLSADSGFSHTTAASFTMTSAQFLRSGWNALQMNSADDGSLNTTGVPAWTYGGTTPGGADTSYPYMRLVVSGMQPMATTTPVLYLGGVFQGGEGQAAVLVNFDDCHQDSVDLCNLYRSYEIPVSLGVVTGTIGLGSQMSESQLRTVYDAGTDLFAHTTDHVVLDTIPLSAAITEMADSRSWLLAKGFSRTADVFAFPQNVGNDRLLAAAKAVGYHVSRWSRPGWLPTAQGIDNPSAVGSRDLGGKTLAQVKKCLDSAELYKCIQILYGHRITSKSVTAMTHAGGVVTVTSAGHGYPNGSLVHHRGANQMELNVPGIVENAAANSYTFRATGVTAGTATTANGMWSFSPDYPAAGGVPPGTLYWNYSDHIALCQEIADRITAGTLVAINFSTLLDRCRV